MPEPVGPIKFHKEAWSAKPENVKAAITAAINTSPDLLLPLDETVFDTVLDYVKRGNIPAARQYVNSLSEPGLGTALGMVYYLSSLMEREIVHRKFAQRTE
jgi:hypothetical protein